ncbi:MAG: hypothetical protein QM733_01245 [Ilumatobacteraceae bacterium]
MLIAAGVTMRTRAEQVAANDDRAGVRVPSREELVELYRAQGLTMVEIAERFGLNDSRVLLLLRRHGIERRPARARPERLQAERAERRPPELVAEILELHRLGRSRNAIARRVGVHTQVVADVVRDAGLELHDRRKLPPFEVWVHRYLDGDETAAEIGATYSVAANTVIRSLRRAGVERRPAKVRQLPLDESEVLACYVDQRLSIVDTAARLGVSVPRVRAVLHGHAVIRRGFEPTSIDRRRFKSQYESGVPLDELSAEFGLSDRHVKFAAREFGLPPRPSHATLDISDERLAALVRSGRSDEEIAAMFDVAVSQVVHRRRGAGIRRPIHPLQIPISRKRLERLLAAGVTRAEIATRHQVSLARVTKWCKHYELEVASSRATAGVSVDIDPVELRRLYITEEWSAAQIGAELGMDPTLVVFALHTHRIPVRESGRGTSDAVIILDELYADADVVAVLRAHDVPLRRRGGSLPKRFPHPGPLIEQLVVALYSKVGLSAVHISLLTGHGRSAVFDALRRSGTPARTGRRSPWFERRILGT